MKKTILLAAAAAVCSSVAFAGADAVAKCGDNEIRLYAAPLSYEVLKGGKTLVEKTQIGVCLDGKCLAKDARVASVASKTLSGTVEPPCGKKASVDLAGF